MNRIETIFAQLRSHTPAGSGGGGARALMPFICGGHPTPDATGVLLEAIAQAERAGREGPDARLPAASIVEVGIPFSDPIADGPVIAAAMHESLQRGVTPAKVFAQIAAYREKERSAGVASTRPELGIVAMMSYSLAWRMGLGATMRLARASGVDGFIFPDLPVEESDEAIRLARAEGLTLSLLVAPSTTPERVRMIVGACTGFVYLLARAGITGADSGGPAADLDSRVALIRTMTDLPIACGFGIGSAEQVRSVVRPGSTNGADAAIVGSALVKELNQATSAAAAAELAKGFVERLAGGLSAG